MIFALGAFRVEFDLVFSVVPSALPLGEMPQYKRLLLDEARIFAAFSILLHCPIITG
jgi:hypothetical protein